MITMSEMKFSKYVKSQTKYQHCIKRNITKEYRNLGSGEEETEH
jgi:hypothetical protein